MKVFSMTIFLFVVKLFHISFALDYNMTHWPLVILAFLKHHE